MDNDIPSLEWAQKREIKVEDLKVEMPVVEPEEKRYGIDCSEIIEYCEGCQ